MSGGHPSEAVQRAVKHLKRLTAKVASSGISDDTAFGERLLQTDPEALVNGACTDPEMHRLLLRIVSMELAAGRKLHDCLDTWYNGYLSGSRPRPGNPGGRPSTFDYDIVLAVTAEVIAEEFDLHIYRSEASDPHCACDVIAVALQEIYPRDDGKEWTYEHVREKCARAAAQVKGANEHPLVLYLRQLW